MRAALLPGLLMALAGLILGNVSNAAAHQVSILPANNPVAALSGLYSVAAQNAATSTAALAATTPTSTAPQNTPVPLATVGAGGSGSLRLNPFDLDFLTSVPNPPLGPLGWAYMAIMLALFAVSAYFYFVKRPEWKRTNTVLRRAAERWGPLGLWIGGLGFLFGVFRMITLDFFDARIWFYAWLLIALVAGGLFFNWYRTVFPKEMEKYQKTQRARQYMPGAAKKGSLPAGPQSARTTRVVPTNSGEASQTDAAKAQDDRKRRRK